MRHLVFITIIISIIGIPISLSAQSGKNITEFSEHTLLFIEELESVLKSYPENAYRAAEKYNPNKLIRAFKTDWNSGKYTDENRKIIYETANQILQSGIEIYPALPDYLYSLMAITNSSQSIYSYQQWSKGIKKYINQKEARRLSFLLNYTERLLNDSLLAEYKNLDWKISNQRFEFNTDSGFIVQFKDKLNLTAVENEDKMTINNTIGTYYPLLYEWKGEKGSVDWTLYKIDPEILNIKLRDYFIDTRKSRFDADSCLLTDMRTFPDKTILGSFSCGTMDKNLQSNIYPAFNSYSTDLVINDLHETGFEYSGGYALKTDKIKGFGSEDNKAKLNYNAGNDINLKLFSEAFNLDKGAFHAKSAIFAITKGQDSIFHPGLLVNYTGRNNILDLVSTNETLSLSPIFDSYHKLDIYAQALQWNLKDSLILIRYREGVLKKAPATFESNNFFKLENFIAPQRYDPINPLVYTYDYCEYYDTNRFFVPQLAHFVRYQPNLIRNAMIDLTLKGFATIDLETDIVTIKDKLINYNKANNKEVDYDNLVILSGESKLNGQLNLYNLDLDIFQISPPTSEDKDIELPPISLSDSQQVYILPAYNTIKMLKNRDFIYSGITSAGMFDLYLDQAAYFSYDTFNIRMPKIKAIRFMVFMQNEYGSWEIYPVRSVLENLIGNLKVDQSDNKAGLKRTELKYPILETDTNYSSVFYNQAYVPGVYPRDRFRFALYPDTLYDLDEFDTDSIEFKGRLLSGGIFPDIERPLKTRKDLSLGFVHPTPTSGFPTYGGKGTFTGIVDLSLNGLRGDGELRFLGSVSRSDPNSIWDDTDFIFLPDSMIGVAEDFFLEPTVAGTEYPMAKGKNVSQKWFHLDDEMVISDLGTPMNVYNDSTFFEGDLMLRPDGLFGKGMLEFEETQIRSPFFHFKHHELDADTSFMKIHRRDSVGVAFKADNYKAYINFEDRKGDFQSNIGSVVQFPLNQYVSTMYNFNWFMNDYKIELYSETDIDNYYTLKRMNFREVIAMNELNEVRGPELISTRPDQDSLNFISFRATYTLEDHLINAKNIRFIEVADAYVFPKQDSIIIKRNAEMDMLRHSDIVTKHDTIHHHFYNADIQVYSKNQLFALGTYDYVDGYNNKQSVFFDEISVMQDPTRTIARGDISDTSRFKINPYFDFQGKVELASNNPWMSYNGYFKINYDCDTTRMSWIEFDTTLTSGQIRIPVGKFSRTKENKPVFSGVGYNRNGGILYSRFLGTERLLQDSSIFYANGLVEYDNEKAEYRLGSISVLNDAQHPDNLMVFETKKCIRRGQGAIRLIPELNRKNYLKTYAHGTFEHQLITDSIQFDVNMFLDFVLPRQLSNIIIEDLNGDNAISNEPLDISQKKYLPFLASQLGMQQASEIQMNIMFDEKKFPKSFEKFPFIFTDVHFDWHNEGTEQVFYCRKPFGIMSSSGKLVKKKFKGMMRILRWRKRQEFELMIQINESNYYYFKFDNSNKLQTYSTNSEYMTLIKDNKGKFDKTEEEGKKEDKASARAEYSIKSASKDDALRFRTEVMSY